MKRVGDILKEERLRKQLTILEVSKITKIRKEYISYIEKGEYSRLPAEVYTQGFIRNYATALGLDVEKILPFYRREQRTNKEDVTTEIPQPLEKVRFKLTPKRLVTVVVAIGLTVFLGLLFAQYQMFSGTPVLIVDSPVNNLVTSAESIEVSGQTDENATITVNGEDVDVLVSGIFKVSYTLEDGLNRIRIVATSQIGNKSVVERVVEKRDEVPATSQ